jgi:glycine betaine/choline ABC-type transport system substrate-binding protein
MDLGLLYTALSDRKVDLVAGNSTDGQIEVIRGVVLEDDRRYFPPYEAAFVVREAVWRSNPAVRKVLEGLAGAISADAMRRLNAAVDRDKRRPEDVGSEFLRSLNRKA